MSAATAPSWHPAAAMPLDADITAVLRGLKDFAPKPWPQLFRELQAAGGRIEINNARVQQRDTIAVANGALGPVAGRPARWPASSHGRQPRQVSAGRFDLDQMLSQEQAPPQINNAVGALDRFMPGLGNMARKNAAPMIAAGVNMMGQPTELEGKPAVMLPLRFDDGMVSLGPLRLGATPPLF